MILIFISKWKSQLLFSKDTIHFTVLCKKETTKTFCNNYLLLSTKCHTLSLLRNVLERLRHKISYHKISETRSLLLCFQGPCLPTGVELPVVLEIFGEYFLQYCLRHGYDKMLKTLGGNFKSFIQNLDSLHALLALTYKNIVAPSFR